MARPKYDPGEPTARDRLVEAYWEMLAEGTFDKVSARAVVRRAGINHNTFYRYFGGIEDMARKLFDEVVSADLPVMLLGAGDVEGAQAAIDLEDMRKAMLYARSDSSLLQGILRDAIANAWLSAAGVSPSDLTPAERTDCDIIFGGIVAAMGSSDMTPNPKMFKEVLSRPLGQGMIRTLEQIANASR